MGQGPIADLNDICSYIARQDPEAALRMGNGIIDHVRILGQFPFIGPTYPKGARWPLREIVFRLYRIFHDHHEVSTQLQLGEGCFRTAAQPFQRFPVTTAIGIRVNAREHEGRRNR